MGKECIGIKNRLPPMLIISNDHKFGKESIMLTIPSAAEEPFVQFSPGFTKPTFERIVPLAVGAIITMSRRTVTTILRTMRTVARVIAVLIIVSFPGRVGRCGRRSVSALFIL